MRFTRGKARPQAPKKDELNEHERAYLQILEGRLLLGDINGYLVHRLKFRLAGDSTFYTPDFFVQLADGTMELVDTKGGIVQDTSQVKIKVAAEQYPMFGWLQVELKKLAINPRKPYEPTGEVVTIDGRRWELTERRYN